MHDNPQADSATTFALPDHRAISITGRDAVAFAQAQFMNDVGAMAPGQWQWNGWLTPKGRVVALFALLRIDDENVWLLLPDADAASIAAALQRFVFRSKVSISNRQDLAVTGCFTAPVAASDARIGGSMAGSIEIDMGANGGPRCLRIGGVTASNEPAMVARWAAFDLGHGLPRLGASQVERWAPQQLSLERLHAFSIKKGCYPGQEIVARTHFLGTAKRGLALFEAEAPLEAGAEVFGGETSLGLVVSTASVAGSHLGLAVLPHDRAAVALTAGGRPLRELPIADGLAR